MTDFVRLEEATSSDELIRYAKCTLRYVHNNAGAKMYPSSEAIQFAVAKKLQIRPDDLTECNENLQLFLALNVISFLTSMSYLKNLGTDSYVIPSAVVDAHEDYFNEILTEKVLE